MSGLSFSGLPPIDIPFRFFASSILFVIGLAFFIFFSGESLWLSRWHPSMLALTHGFTLGVITPVMMGALLQMLSVVGGSRRKKCQYGRALLSSITFHRYRIINVGICFYKFFATDNKNTGDSLFSIKFFLLYICHFNCALAVF